MTRDRALGGFALLVALAVIVLVLRPLWLPRRTVVHERTVTGPVTVVESPPLTPFRDSGPKNNPQASSLRANPVRAGGKVIEPNTATAPQNRPLPSRKRPGPKTTPTPRPSSQGSPPPPQPPSPQPSQPSPVVGVTAPAPVTVCARPVATVNC